MSHVTSAGGSPARDAVLDSLRAVVDPCCRDRGISVVDMGLVRRVDVADGTARVDLLLTSGWCPFQVDLLGEVAAAAEGVAGVDRADVRIVLDEAWSTDRLSPGARRLLRFLPDPASVPDREAYRAAHSPAGTAPPGPSATAPAPPVPTPQNGRTP